MLLLLVILGYVDQIFDKERCFMCTCAMNTIRSISKVLILRMSPRSRAVYATSFANGVFQHDNARPFARLCVSSVDLQTNTIDVLE